MCPRCDHDRCVFWKLSDSCFYTQITRVFDNEMTVIFALVMSLWGKASKITHILLVGCKLQHGSKLTWHILLSKRKA